MSNFIEKHTTDRKVLVEKIELEYGGEEFTIIAEYDDGEGFPVSREVDSYTLYHNGNDIETFINDECPDTGRDIEFSDKILSLYLDDYIWELNKDG
jgi:hypothetical protein